MGVAEGIESAMSAAILFKMPVWATINGTMMAKWVPPEEAKEIWIFGDNDGNYTGQAKAYALAHRLSVQFGRLVEVHIPEGVGEDWNDVLKSGRGPY
jgi:putative DNA primase/helicase